VRHTLAQKRPRLAASSSAKLLFGGYGTPQKGFALAGATLPQKLDGPWMHQVRYSPRTRRPRRGVPRYSFRGAHRLGLASNTAGLPLLEHPRGDARVLELPHAGVRNTKLRAAERSDCGPRTHPAAVTAHLQGPQQLTKNGTANRRQSLPDAS